MSGDGQIRFELVGHTRVAHLEGEIDLANAWSVSRAIVEAISNQDLKLVVDLTEVRYLDSVGIRMLFDLARRLADHDQRLVVVVPSVAPIRRAIDVSGLPGEVALVESVRAATRST
jgi:anti-anti-sigma factor